MAAPSRNRRALSFRRVLLRGGIIAARQSVLSPESCWQGQQRTSEHDPLQANGARLESWLQSKKQALGQHGVLDLQVLAGVGANKANK